MTRASTWLVAAGQLSLCFGIALCYFTAPNLLHAAEEGVSHYGVYKPTVAPYTLAFLLAALCSGIAAYFVAKQSPVLSVLLGALAVLYAAILISTYSYQRSQGLRDIHIILGSTLYIVQFLASFWLLWRVHPSSPVIILFTIQIAGSLLSLFSLLNIVLLLLVGQAITAISFGVLLVLLVHYTTAVP